MRIAHIVCTYPPYFGGMGNVVFQMASELGDRGHEVVVFTPHYYEPKEIRGADAPEARTHEDKLQERIDYAKRLTPDLQYGNAARMPALAQELDGMDIVHFHYPFFGTANLVRKWKLRNPKKPLVITYHMDTRGPGWKGLVFKAYAKYYLPKMLRVADLLIGSSFDYIEASDARELFLADKKKWLELPFGVDTERFQPREQPEELFFRHHLSHDKVTLLFVGGMDYAHYFKGVPVLLDALLLLKKNHLPFQAVFVGDGELKTDFENRAKFIGVGEDVRFVGHVSDDELPFYYNLADLFILPSVNRGEAFGMVLIEALASGVPVIASDLPGVRSVAKQAGMVFTPGKSLNLAQAILSFCGATDHEARFVRARKVAEEEYSWDRIAAKLEEAYKGLVEK